MFLLRYAYSIENYGAASLIFTLLNIELLDFFLQNYVAKALLDIDARQRRPSKSEAGDQHIADTCDTSAATVLPPLFLIASERNLRQRPPRSAKGKQKGVAKGAQSALAAAFINQKVEFNSLAPKLIVNESLLLIFLFFLLFMKFY